VKDPTPDPHDIASPDWLLAFVGDVANLDETTLNRITWSLDHAAAASACDPRPTTRTRQKQEAIPSSDQESPALPSEAETTSDDAGRQ